MQDDIDFHRPALTVGEAKNLVTRISDLVIERDRLREESDMLRSILSELAAIRELVGCDVSGAVIARAASNGHFGAAGDEFCKPETAAEATVHTLGCESETPPETTAADRHEEPAGDDVYDVAETDDTAPETDADMLVAAVDFDGTGAASSVSVTAPEPEASLPPMAGHTERHGGVDACERHTVATSGRPPEGTLLLRILRLFEQSPRPLSRWNVQQQLSLPRMPSAELSRLTQQGHLVRLREATYGIPGRTYTGPSQASGN